MRLFSCLTVIVVGLLVSATASAASLDTIVITQGRDNPTKVAVVPTRMDPALGNLPELADIVSFDLARSGDFAPIDADNMLSLPSRPEEVFFRDWRILGAEYMVVSHARSQADGNVALEFFVFDVPNQREMATEVVVARRDQWRDIAHHVADVVYEKVTGVRGAFSTKIAYVLARNAGTSQASYSIEMADSDGERSQTLFSSTEPLMSVSWSPDGKKLAYVSFETKRPSVVIHDVASGARERVSSFKGINGSPVFSPDGSQLAMVLSRDGNPEIYVMNLADRSLRRITRNHAIDTEPSWTPDGRSLIFTSDRSRQPQIYQVDLTTNLPERLTFEGNYNARARMLDDGNLVYVHRSTGTFHIAWQDLRRGRVVPLTRTDLDESPSVAPNGAMLIYATQDRGRGILGVVSIDGSVKYQLPSSSGDVREPAWSPFMNVLNVGR